MQRKVILATSIGNAFEWYEFSIFINYLTIITQLFFPSNDPFQNLLIGLLIYGVGFFSRPIGGVLFAYIGDRFSRKTSLYLTIILMALPTFIIGILPTYKTIGIYAPILLGLMRFLQGLSMGGELAGAVTFTMEHASQKNRGFIGAILQSSVNIGVLSGSLVCYMISYFLTEEELYNFGWRIPFLISIFITLIGIYTRTKLKESKVFDKSNHLANPLVICLKHHRKQLLQATLIGITSVIGFFTITSFFLNYSKAILNYSLETSLISSIFSHLIMIICALLSGKLSDYYGRKKIFGLSCLLIIGVFIVSPIIIWFKSDEIILLQMLTSIVFGFYAGCMFAILAEIFPTPVRYTGISLAQNISSLSFGATTPIILTAIAKSYNLLLAIIFLACYYSLFAYITYRFLRKMPDLTGKELM